MQVQLINLNGMQGMPSGMGMMSGMMGGGSPGGGGGQMSAICSHEKGTTGGSGRSANAG